MTIIYNTPKNRMLVAAHFSELLRGALTRFQMDDVRIVNGAEIKAAKKEGREPRFCASQDFIDANMVMDEAIKRALGNGPFELSETQEDGDGLSQDVTDLFNEAWAIAAKDQFRMKVGD